MCINFMSLFLSSIFQLHYVICFKAKDKFPCEWFYSILFCKQNNQHKCKLYLPASLNKVQRLVSNSCTPPEGPECDARDKSKQTTALPSIFLTFFPL